MARATTYRPVFKPVEPMEMRKIESTREPPQQSALDASDSYSRRMLLKLADLDHLDLVVDSHVEALRWARDLAEDSVVAADAHAQKLTELEEERDAIASERDELKQQVEELEKEAQEIAADRDTARAERERLKDDVFDLLKDVAVADEALVAKLRALVAA